VPLVFVSLVAGITAMSDSAKLGRISVKTIAIYLVTTAFAVSIGLLFGALFAPGEGMNMVASGIQETKQAPSLVQILVGLVPTNPVTAFAEGNILQIIVFAIALGVSMNLIGEKAAPAVKLFDSLAEVFYKLTDLVMRCAPIGVFALIAGVVASHGIEVLLPLASVIGVIYLASIAHMLLVYGGLLAMLARLSPLRFFKGVAPALAVAFSTSSSAGTLPVSIECARKNLGVSQGVAGFVLPVGATINMGGAAITITVLTLAAAHTLGIQVDLLTALLLSVVAAVSACGASGVAGGSLLLIPLACSLFGISNDVAMQVVAVGFIIGVVQDAAETALNSSTDVIFTAAACEAAENKAKLS